MKKIAKAVCLVGALTLVMSSCVTTSRVTFMATDPKGKTITGANVSVDGQPIGVTPATMEMSNGVWNSPEVRVSKEGYNDYRGDVNKEVKAVNLVCGIILWWPSLLWCYGPKPTQYVVLTKE